MTTLEYDIKQLTEGRGVTGIIPGETKLSRISQIELIKLSTKHRFFIISAAENGELLVEFAKNKKEFSELVFHAYQRMYRAMPHLFVKYGNSYVPDITP